MFKQGRDTGGQGIFQALPSPSSPSLCPPQVSHLPAGLGSRGPRRHVCGVCAVCVHACVWCVRARVVCVRACGVCACMCVRVWCVCVVCVRACVVRVRVVCAHACVWCVRACVRV